MKKINLEEMEFDISNFEMNKIIGGKLAPPEANNINKVSGCTCDYNNNSVLSNSNDSTSCSCCCNCTCR